MENDVIIFASNCYGEDRSAAIIAKELKKLTSDKDIAIYGASLISGGEEYHKRNIETVFTSKLPPSGGFTTQNIFTFLADLFSCSFVNIFRYINALKKYKNNAKLVVVIGDTFLAFITRMAIKHTPLVFMSLPKSDYIEPHYKVEANFIMRHTSIMLTRDKYTKDNMVKRGVEAIYLGNPIMDELETKGLKLPLDKDRLNIGILPGSRDEAYANFKMILDVIDILADKRHFNYITGLPDNMDIKKIKRCAKGWELAAEEGIDILAKRNAKVYLTKGSFTDVLSMSDIIISLAGTASEQAAGMGKPIIAFAGKGPQTTKKRFTEQEKLLGGAVKFVRDYPDGVVDEVLYLSNLKEIREMRGEKGKARMGEPGASKKIAEYINKQYL